MRVNIYAEEMTERIAIISKKSDGQVFTGLRFYLELPCTGDDGDEHRGPFMHRPGDDDSSAVTFWGKQDLRRILRKALNLLDAYYDGVAERQREEAKIDSERTQNNSSRDAAVPFLRSEPTPPWPTTEREALMAEISAAELKYRESTRWLDGLAAIGISDPLLRHHHDRCALLMRKLRTKLRTLDTNIETSLDAPS